MTLKLQYECPKDVCYRQIMGSGKGTFPIIAAVTIIAVMLGSFSSREARAASPDRALPGRFGRIFQNLPSFAPPKDSVRAALMELGKPGGLIDAKDNLNAGPADLIVDPQLSLNNPNSPVHTAGTTFMAQFLVHDITFDTTSQLGKPTRPDTASNGRNPFFDLDSVYGDGPACTPPSSSFTTRRWI